MRAHLVLLLLVTPALVGFVDATATNTWSRVSAPGPHAILPPTVVHLASEVDGAAIAMVVYRPDVPSGTRVPVLVRATPYLAATTPEAVESSEFASLENIPRIYDFVPHGYAYAFLSVRGTGDSGGCIDLFGANEASDVDQAVTWLGSQEWSNGNVGMMGLSYDGTTPFLPAARGNPHLKTIVTLAGVSDLYDLFFANGTTQSGSAPALATHAFYGLSFARACAAPAEGAWEATLAAATLQRSAYWEERNHRDDILANYTGSVLFVHGLHDGRVAPSHALELATELEARGLAVHRLFGQWAHSFPDYNLEPHPLHPDEPIVTRRADWADIQLRWYDRWLKGDETVDLGPRNLVAGTDGVWRASDTWPPEEAEPTTLHLEEGGRLARRPSPRASQVPVAVPGEPTGLGGLIHPQFEPADCYGCLRFESAPLRGTTRIAGYVHAPLTLTPLAPAGDIAARLSYERAGERVFLGWAALDLRFADGTETPRDVRPGEPLVARLQLEPMDAVVPKGARLVLDIHTGQSDFHTSDSPVPILLHVGGGASRLVLPTLEP